MENTMYWKLQYRGLTGWKIKYLFGYEESVINYINKRIKYDKVEYNNLTLSEVKTLEEYHKVKFQVLKG
jgi:hypothetical protein